MTDREAVEAAARMFSAGEDTANSRRVFMAGVEWGRAHPAPTPTRTYVGLAPCGCMEVAMFGGGDLPDDDAEIRDWLDRGLTVKSATEVEYRALPIITQCPHLTGGGGTDGTDATGLEEAKHDARTV